MVAFDQQISIQVFIHFNAFLYDLGNDRIRFRFDSLTVRHHQRERKNGEVMLLASQQSLKGEKERKTDGEKAKSRERQKITTFISHPCKQSA